MISTFAGRRRRAGLCAAALLLAACAAAPGCGKKGPPRPPLRIRPEAPKGVEIRQRGATLWVVLAEPAGRTDGSPFVEEVVVRLVQLPDGATGAGPTARRKRRRAPANVAAWVVPRSEWPAYRVDRRLEIPIAVSSLAPPSIPSESGPSGRRVAFLAEVREGKRLVSAPAGPVTIDLCAPPPAPRGLEAIPGAAGLRLVWSAAAEPAIATRIYRAVGAAPFGERPWRSLPAATAEALDDGVTPGTAYRYEVRAARGGETGRCESEPASVAATYVDAFPPAPPQGLAAAAEEDLIRLFWTPSPEPDVAGYLVYRRDDPAGAYRRLTPDPIPETTWADAQVERGRRYAYVVTAVDAASPRNESGRSEPAEERLP